MREEHMMILKMLEEGKITSEEAAALIDALDEATEAGPGSPGGQRGGSEPPGGLGEAAGETAGPSDERGDSAGAGAEAGADGEDTGETEGGGTGECARKWGPAGRGPDLSKIRALADRLAHLAEASYGPALESLADRIEKAVGRAVEEKERAMRRVSRAKERAAGGPGGENDSGPHGCFRWGEPPFTGEAFTEPFLGAFAPGVRVKKSFEGAFDGQFERVTVEAVTSNGGIAIEPWDGPGFRVEVRARVRGVPSDPAGAQARLEEAVDYEAGPGKLRIDCSGGRAVSGASLTIQLPRRFKYDLDLETSNGKVEIGSLDCGTIDVETSNGRIDLDGTSTAIAELETSNGRIQCRGAAKKLVAETSNGSIFVASGRPSGDAVYELETSNGSIEVQLAVADDVGCRVEAETSHGGIHVALPDLVYQVNRKSMGHEEIVATTPDYEAKASTVRIKAETSNGSIAIISADAGAGRAGRHAHSHPHGAPGGPGASDAPGAGSSERTDEPEPRGHQ
ncbi:MAG: DUF4097 family beta strand repeat-containing protein [Bacteroidota bacterium]